MWAVTPAGAASTAAGTVAQLTAVPATWAAIRTRRSVGAIRRPEREEADEPGEVWPSCEPCGGGAVQAT